MKTIQLLQIPKEELMQDFENIVYRVLEKLKMNSENQDEKTLYTRDEAKELLKVSYTTLFHWNNLGILKAKMIGKRVYYHKDEVLSCINSKTA